MIELLTFSLIASLWCVGISLASDEEFILNPIAKLSEKYLPIVLHKPLIGCVYCMASLHGILLYCVASYIDWIDFKALEMIISIPIISALNGIIISLHNKLL